jgi:hypothetical protein
MHPVNILFDIVFPLDRYVGIHTLQNNIVFDKFREDQGLFTATKLASLGLMGVTGTAHDVTEGVDPQVDVDEMNVAASETSLGDFWDMFYQALQKMVTQAYAKTVRTLANYGDFAYNDMRTQYKENHCDMKSGLTTELVGTSLLQFDRFTLNKGFGTKDGKKQYVPVTSMGLDLLLSLLPTPNNLALAQIARHVAGIAINSDTRYGYPLLLFGQIGLSAPQLTSETLSSMNEKKQCQDGQAVDVEPDGLCKDEDEES